MWDGRKLCWARARRRVLHAPQLDFRPTTRPTCCTAAQLDSQPARLRVGASRVCWGMPPANLFFEVKNSKRISAFLNTYARYFNSYVAVYAYFYVCVYVYIYTHVKIYIYVYMYICKCIYIYICTYRYIYIYLYMYIYTYTYTKVRWTKVRWS